MSPGEEHVRDNNLTSTDPFLKKVKIPYFPIGLKYATAVLFALAVYIGMAGSIVWALILAVSGVIILSTHYVTEIDMTGKRYRDYISFLAMRLNEDSGSFSHVDRIVISKGNYSQTINTRVQSRQLDWTDFTGTLIFDSGTLDLLTRTDKAQLIRELKEFAAYCNVGIEDQTTPRHHWIDLTRIE